MKTTGSLSRLSADLIISLTFVFLSFFHMQDAMARNYDITCGPWIQDVSENGFTVLWKTDGKSLSWLEVAPDDGTPFEACARERFYETCSGKRFTGDFHAVTVTGLEAGQTYRYRILGREVIDDSNPYASIYGKEATLKLTGKVRTSDYGADSCVFSMVCDIHDRAQLYKDLTSPLKGRNTDFLLLNGDIVSYSHSIDTVMMHTFAPISDISADIPVVFARGNHESRGADSYLMSRLFRTPTGEFYYIFRQGPVAFVVLDAGEDKPDSSVEYSGLADYDAYRTAELEWLKSAVEDPLFRDAPVKIALCHIPVILNRDSWYTQAWISRNFTPVLNSAGVDLMLSGHHHRHIHVRAGECGNDFPIVANDDTDRLDVEVGASEIKVRTYNTGNALTHSYDFSVSR